MEGRRVARWRPENIVVSSDSELEEVIVVARKEASGAGREKQKRREP